MIYGIPEAMSVYLRMHDVFWKQSLDIALH